MEQKGNSAPSLGTGNKAKRRQRGCLILFVIGLVGLWGTTVGIMIIAHNNRPIPLLVIMTLLGIAAYYIYMRR